MNEALKPFPFSVFMAFSGSAIPNTNAKDGDTSMQQSFEPFWGFAIAQLLFLVFVSLIGLAFFVFWLVVLIDCIKNEPSEGNDKVIWILLIVLLHALGALLYLLIRKPQRKERYGV